MIKLLETTANKNVEANIFIIPNQATKFGELFESAQDEYKKYYNLNPEDYMVQVWIATPGNSESNWQCHNIDTDKPLTDSFIKECCETITRGSHTTITFPLWMPVDYIKDLKEGETFIIGTDDMSVTLTAAQLQHRYQRFGKFEDVLRKLVNLD